MLALVFLLLAGCFSPPPKQAELWSKFRANQPIYEILRDMAVEDDLFAAIHYGSEYAKRPFIFESNAAVGIPDERAETYRLLMRHADVSRVDVNEGGEVSMSMAAWGMANRGWRVSAVWRPSPPDKLLSSLDAFQRTSKSSNDWDVAYAPASGNWYFRIIW